MKAAVFINWMIPVGMGHVGWGFEYSPGNWCYGGLETAGVIIGKGEWNNTNNSFGQFNEMIKNMKGVNRPGCLGKDPGTMAAGYPYHEYKTIDVSNTDVNAALNRIVYIKNNGYGLHGNNCMDAVFNVIKAYARGNDRVLPWPCYYWAPRWWYAAIPGSSIVLQSQAATGNWFSQHAAG